MANEGDRWKSEEVAETKDAILLLISGKRKCGKDFISQLVHDRLGKHFSKILHISAPLKQEFAKTNQLDYARLLDPSAYKEQYRAEMVRWGEEMRRKDASCFCRKAIQSAESCTVPVWIVADIRRRTDLDYFNQFKNVKVRVKSSPGVRCSRGWVFTTGIDDSETEMDLDSYSNWDFVITNDGDDTYLLKSIEDVCSHLKAKVVTKR